MPVDTGRSFIRGALNVFEDARAEATERPERVYCIAGATVRVRYAGNRLADRFDVALAPLAATSPVDVTLGVSCWDRTTVNRPPPPPPWSDHDRLPRGRIRAFDRDGIRATYDTTHGLLNVYDPETKQAICFAQDADRVPPWVARAPFRTVFGWWSTDRGLAVAHASAVGSPDGCVLITGPSGSGKSTTALACVARGFGLVCDDVALVAVEPSPIAYASSGIAKIETPSPVELDALGGDVVEQHGEQTMLDLRDRLVRHAPVRAVIGVQVGETSRCRIRSITPGACFRALAGHSVVEALSGDARSLASLRTLARSVPSFSLELGSDLDDVVSAVRGVLDEAR